VLDLISVEVCVVVILIELIPHDFTTLCGRFTYTTEKVLIPVPISMTEWDLGGFPAWLLAVKPRLQLRTSDPVYLKLVSYQLNEVSSR